MDLIFFRHMYSKEKYKVAYLFLMKKILLIEYVLMYRSGGILFKISILISTQKNIIECLIAITLLKKYKDSLTLLQM